MKNFIDDDLAWADFLISKAALIFSSIVLFAALFQLIADFKDFEVQKQLDSLTLDFKNAVDRAGTNNFQETSKEFPAESSEEFKETTYRFNEKTGFRALFHGGNLIVRVSGEYVSLETESNGRNLSAVRPFTFRILPFNKPILQEKLYKKFGANGSLASPLAANFSDVEAFVRTLGTEVAILDPELAISLKKEIIFIKENEEVSAIDCILIYQ